MDIPFESFAKLIFRLGNPPKSNKSKQPISPEKIFASWLNHLPKPFPPQTGKRLFRLLYPHEGSRRRYGLKETKLAAELERLLGLNGLSRWDSVSWARGGEAGTGCLGREVEIAMKDRGASSSQSTLSLCELDMILDELAATSPFSQLSQQPSTTRSTSALLSVLFRESHLSPYATSVLTQVVLRDLRPLLNPLPRLPIRNPTAMLRLKSTAGPEQLSLRQAMRHWDENMWHLYAGGRGNLDWCVDMAEIMANDGDPKRVSEGPILGVNVKIPKCRKGRSVEDALKSFVSQEAPCETVWAETKYDGYRMQIHVETLNHGQPKITIFSKSMRDSTQDRLNAHAIILAALGLPIDPSLPAHPALIQRAGLVSGRDAPMRHSVVLEAEVVPYNEGSREGGRGPGIEEFWHLGSAGVTVGGPGWTYPVLGFSRMKDRHLCLIFFDILHMDGDSLLKSRYDDRRRILEAVVTAIPGFVQLAERTRIPLNIGSNEALETLNSVFTRSNDRREEGLVLKAADSMYTDMRWPWVKLKKDYIPNLGDCIDLVLLGAGWDIDRARELRVDTSVFTTFYIGIMTNAERVKLRRELPHFEVLFRVSYGLDRSQLEVYNGNLRHGRWSSKPYDKDDPFKRRLIGLSWIFTIPRGMNPPSVLLEQPLCAEVMGAGFQKLPGSDLYELRWPRLQKVYDERDRPWTEALRAHDLIITAHRSLGYKTTTPLSPRSPDDSINAAWRSSSSAMLVDIPEMISPRSPKRARSAPDLQLDIFKTSPVRPSLPSRRGLRSPLRPLMRGSAAVKLPATGRKLMEIMSAGNTDICHPSEVDRPNNKSVSVSGSIDVSSPASRAKRPDVTPVHIIPTPRLASRGKKRRNSGGPQLKPRTLSLRCRMKIAMRRIDALPISGYL